MKKIVLLFIMSSVVLMAFDGKSAYKQCGMCHGKKGEKVALKSSPKLNTLTQEKLSSSLKALIDGTSTVSSKYLGMHQKKLKKVTVDDTGVFAQYILDLK